MENQLQVGREETAERQLQHEVLHTSHLPSVACQQKIAGLTESEARGAEEVRFFVKRVVGCLANDNVPSQATLEKIEYLFDVISTLAAAGAPSRLIVEAVLHPVVFPDGNRETSRERRAVRDAYLKRTLFEDAFQKAENKFSVVPSRCISYARPTPSGKRPPDWGAIKEEILGPILQKLQRSPDFCPLYKDSELSAMRQALKMSLDSIAQIGSQGEQSSIQPTRIWYALQGRLDIGITLLLTKKSVDAVISGLFYELRETIPEEKLTPTLHRMGELYGSRVREMVDRLSFSPQQVVTSNEGAFQAFASSPVIIKNLEAMGPEIRGDAAALVSATAHCILGDQLKQASSLARSVDTPDWSTIPWGDLLSLSSAFSDTIHSDHTLRIVFDEQLQNWTQLPKYLPGSVSLMAARERFGELFPRSYESTVASEDSISFVRGVIRHLMERACEEDNHRNLHSGFLANGGAPERLREAVESSEACRSSKVMERERIPSEEAPRPVIRYTDEDRELLAKAVDYLAIFLEKGEFKDDKVREPLDQMKHACEVGYLLLEANAPAYLIIAGLLHDIYEISKDENVASERTLITRMFGHLGGRVDRLIEIVTEPPKNPQDAHQNYIYRKTKVMEGIVAIRDSAPHLATDASALMCASKLSTMRDGFYHGAGSGAVQPWSKGSWSENMRAMCTLHGFFDSYQIPPALLGAYREEMRMWAWGLTFVSIPSTVENDRGSRDRRDVLRVENDTPYFLLEDKTLREGLNSFYRCARKFDRKTLLKEGLYDASALIAAAQDLGVNFLSDNSVQDAARVSGSQILAIFNEVGRSVLLPQGVGMFARVERNILHLFLGQIEDGSVQPYRYLGCDMKALSFRVMQGPELIKPQTVLDVDSSVILCPVIQGPSSFSLDYIARRARAGDHLANRVVETIIEHRISPAEYERITQYDSHLFRALATAEDRRFLDLLYGEGKSNSFDPKFLTKGHAIEELLSQPQGQSLVIDYSSKVGGLVKQIEHYVERRDFVSAKLAILVNYLEFKKSQKRVSKWPRGAYFDRERDPRAVPAFFLKELHKRLPPQTLQRKLFSGGALVPHVDGFLKALQHCYYSEFSNLHERAHFIERVDRSQGRPTHPTVEEVLRQSSDVDTNQP